MSEREVIERLAWLDNKLSVVVQNQENIERRIKQVESMVQQLGQLLQRKR